jgi:uncharacterized repeat protein (TIGR04076 family)
MTQKEYREKWKELEPIRIRMIEKSGECKHAIGDTFVLENPYTRPAGLCSALLHVVDLYTWRVVLGFPSWEKDDRSVYRIHCPSKLGTVWEMTKAPAAD